MRTILIIIASFMLFSACTKTTNCECVPPPFTIKNYIITERVGGIAGMHATLTEDQKNSRLTISEDGTFKVKNVVTNTEVTGTYRMSLFQSIYGEKTRIIFTPDLPMLQEEFHIITEVKEGKLVLADNNYDGFSTSFEAVP